MLYHGFSRTITKYPSGRSRRDANRRSHAGRELSGSKSQARVAFFDKIAALALEHVIQVHRHHIHGERHLADELEWLQEQGLLIEATSISRVAASNMNQQLDLLAAETLQELAHVGELHKVQQETDAKIEDLPWREVGDGVRSLSKEGDPTNLLHSNYRLQLEMRTFICRAIAAQARIEQKADVVCLETPRLSNGSGLEPFMRGDVIKILVGNLPVPDEGTPWEHIKEFRSDPDSARRLSQLKTWARDAAKGSIDRIELEERLSHLRHACLSPLIR